MAKLIEKITKSSPFQIVFCVYLIIFCKIDPTLSQSINPTVLTTFVPSTNETFPSLAPTYSLITNGTSVSTGNPNSAQTYIPSSPVVHSSAPTSSPIVNVTSVLTGIPNSVQSLTPSLLPSFLPTDSLTDSPSFRQSTLPTTGPSFSPSTASSVTPTSVPSNSSSPALLGPVVLNVSTEFIRNTLVTLRVLINPSGSREGLLFCTAFDPATTVSSTDQVISAGIAVSYRTNDTDQGSSAAGPPSSASSEVSVGLTIGSLTALSQYSLYCYVENSFGVGSTLNQTLETRVEVTTSCCRAVSFINSPAWVYGNTSAYASSSADLYLFRYELSSAPTDSVTFVPTLEGVNSSDVAQLGRLSISPRNTTFQAGDSDFSGSFIVSGDSFVSGSFKVSLLPSGPSAAQYRLASVNFQVLASSALPPSPELYSVTFSDAGNSLLFEFDLDTDRAVSVLSDSPFWTCAEVFSYAGASEASCSWINNSFVTGTFGEYLADSDFVEVGEPVTLKADTILARCVAQGPCSTEFSS